MSKAKFFTSLVLAVSLLVVQVGVVFAAPAFQKSAPITGTVQSITLETDPNTGVTTVIVEVTGSDQAARTVRISQATARRIGLVAPDGDGNLVINESALGKPVEIDPAAVIPDQQPDRHPIGNALATFFSDIVDYDTIMAAHDEGVGFGVIAQALWLTKQLDGDSEVFQALLHARETGDYSAFTINGVTPKNWGQLRKAILDGKKIDEPGNTVSNQNNTSNQNKDKDKDKDKNKDKGKDKDKGNNDNNGNNGGGNDKNKEKKK